MANITSYPNVSKSHYIVTMLTKQRELYERAFQKMERAPLYGAGWWLDATCGNGGWEVYTYLDEYKMPFAFIPYYKTKIRGMTAIITPPFSQWLPVIGTLGEHKILLDDFMNSLSGYSILDISFRQDSQIILQGPEAAVNSKYSYLIDSSQGREEIRSKYNEGLRRNLREAEKKYSIEEIEDVDTFIKLCQSTYQQRKTKAPPWLAPILPRVFYSLIQHQCGRIEIAIHKGKAIAGILTGWDAGTTYYLSGGRSGDDDGASAHAFLLDHAITTANRSGCAFDFEGSMNPGIANFFQSFGSTPVGYWQIRKFRGPGKIWSLLHI